MECMCAQTRRSVYILARKRFWGMESEPMLTPREKSPLPEKKKISSEEDRTHDAASSRIASPTHYQQAIPASVKRYYSVLHSRKKMQQYADIQY